MAEAAAILEALRSIYDPCCRERGISIVDMGLVRSVHADEAQVKIELILTSGWCPFATRVLSDVRQVVEAMPGTETASVEIVWDEAWTMDRLSDEARSKLTFLPAPIQVQDRQQYIQVHSPQPGSSQREEVASDDR